MSCGAFTFVEYPRKLPDGRVLFWAFARVWLPKDYALFGLMAGARQKGPAVVAPRGLPKDVSLELKREHSYCDFIDQKESWLTEEEFAEVCRRYSSLPDQERSEETLGIVEAIERSMSSLPGSRVVFWFDAP